MKIIDKLLLPVALAFAVAAGGVAAHLARSIPANAAAPNGIELPIVMYHHVLKEAGRLNQFTISPDEFRMDMQYLKDCGYSPIVIQDLINYVQDGAPLPEKPVMTPKSVSLVKANDIPADECLVFEGFMDFLSAVTLGVTGNADRKSTRLNSSHRT